MEEWKQFLDAEHDSPYLCYAALDFCDIPKAFRGAPILFIYLGLISLALFGLVGHQLAL